MHSPRCGCIPLVVPRLTASEQRLARWLEERLRFVGASTFVARRGVPLILAGLHDGLLVWYKVGNNRGRWEPNREVRNPAGFLRWLVDQRVREAPSTGSGRGPR